MAHNQEPLSKTPIIKFKGQDFNYLWDCCLSRGLLFEDETFPAEVSSIGLELLKGKDLSSLKWKRPKVSEPSPRHNPGPCEAPMVAPPTERRVGLRPGFQGWPKPNWKQSEIHLVLGLQCCILRGIERPCT